MTTIETKVIECAAQAYNIDVSDITLDTVIREKLSNQSLKMIGFIGCLEDELDVKIEFRDTLDLKTIRDFVDKVNQLAE
jgi:acyl carrier protein